MERLPEQEEEGGVPVESNADLRFDSGLVTAKYNNALTIASY